MYCIRCKKQTDTTNEQFTTSKNNRRMKRGKCAVCGITKTHFVKSTKGGSILNKMINNLPVEILLKNNDTATRNAVCDKNMLKEMNDIYNPTLRERMERGLVSTLIGTKKRFGWGVTTGTGYFKKKSVRISRITT